MRNYGIDRVVFSVVDNMLALVGGESRSSVKSIVIEAFSLALQLRR